MHPVNAITAALCAVMFAVPVFAQGVPAEGKVQEVLTAYAKVQGWQAQYEYIRHFSAVEMRPYPEPPKPFEKLELWTGPLSTLRCSRGISGRSVNN
jgi:hypothetical protein